MITQGVTPVANGTIHQTMGVPDYDNGYDVTALAVLNGTFTVPQNGYMHFTILPDATQNANAMYCVQLTKDSINYRNFVSWQGAAVGTRSFALVPVSAGDVLTVWNCEHIAWTYTGQLPNTTYYPKFIPCK